MNVFYLHEDAKIAAQYHCDKHMKMIVESAQLLSTAHRMLDGTEIRGVKYLTKTGKLRTKTMWVLEGEGLTDGFLSNKLDHYDAVSHFHPSNIWARSASGNYEWLFSLFEELLIEYNHRYRKNQKVHGCVKLLPILRQLPKNITIGDFTPPPPSMPEEYKVPDDVVQSYKNYYVGAKVRFARWTNREVPAWFSKEIPDYVESNFYRTNSVPEEPLDGGERVLED